MGENADDTADGLAEEPADQSADYHVVLLVERQLTAADAAQVRSLHEALEERVTYHVLLPLDDAAARVEASLGSISGGDMLAPAAAMTAPDLDAVRRDCEDRSTRELGGTVTALESAGALVGSSTVVEESPVDALSAKVAEVDGREAIVLTAPHVVAEFFHLDWTSKARRAIGVPVLHLLEHETFDEQAGGGEGVTGL